MVGVSNKKLREMKRMFSENVASMHNEEVFGIKRSGVSWECLYRDFLIIETLECHTTEVLSQMDINCLAGKVTQECNC